MRIRIIKLKGLAFMQFSAEAIKEIAFQCKEGSFQKNAVSERFSRLNKVESSLWDGRDKTKIINNQCERVYWEATKIKHQYRLSNEGVGRFF